MYALIGQDSPFNKQRLYGKIQNVTWVEIPSLETLNKAVRSHADMLCCPVGDTLVVEPTLYEGLVRAYSGLEAFMVRGQTVLRDKYPGNIAYNVAFIGAYAVHNTCHTDPVLKACIDAAGYKWIHVNQGYSNCMILPVGARSLITSDSGVEEALRAYGMEVLLIEPGEIDLPGYNYGFIGGAAMCIEETIVFFGRLDAHPHKESIRNFIEDRAHAIIEIGANDLVDIGSVRILK